RAPIRIAAPLRVEQPVRAACAIAVEPFTIVAAHALGHENPALPDRAPLARVLAHLTAAALGPPRDAEHGERREQPERRADRAQEAAIEVADEDARDEQRAERDPEPGRRVESEHPERLDVAIERDVLGEPEIADRAGEDRILHERRAPLD